MVMPFAVMGAHVSAVPNHQVGRVTPLTTRGHVAMMGQFGYELDLSVLTDEELRIVSEQIRLYKEIGAVVHRGDLYRLRSPFEGRNTAWEYVAEDGKSVVLMYCVVRARAQTGLSCVRLQGLDPSAWYRDRMTGKRYGGDYLMQVGLYVDDDCDCKSFVMILDRE